MTFEIVGDDQKDKWNSFVDNSPYGDVLQYWEWGEVKREEGWEPLRVWLKSGKDVGIVGQLLIKRVSGLGNYFYMPHGPLFAKTKNEKRKNKESLGKFVQGLKNLAVEKGAFVIEIEPKIGSFIEGLGGMSEGLEHFVNPEYLDVFKSAGFSRTSRNMQSKHKLLFDLSKSDDELLAMMKKNTRYNVGYAERKGVEVIETKFSDKEASRKLDKFYEMLLENQKRTKGYPIRPKRSFEKLVEEFKGLDNLVFEEAVHEGDTLAMNITQRTKHWSSSFYGASLRLKSNLKATYLLRWKSIQSAKSYGSKVYDFWGFVPNAKQHKGYSEHKISFGGTRIDHVGLMAMPINKMKYQVWNNLIPLRAKLSGLFRSL